MASVPASADSAVGVDTVLGNALNPGRPAGPFVLDQDALIASHSPFGRLYGLPTIMDESLNPDDLIVFEGHTHAEAIRLRGRDFQILERPQRLAFARPKPR